MREFFHFAVLRKVDSDAAGSFLKEADTSSDDKPETEDTGAETGETITEE